MKFLKLLTLISYLFLSISLAISASTPKEELIIIQTVSKDHHSFIVNKGAKEGLTKGVEIIYSNDNISILCKAIEVNRNYSLWAPLDPSVFVPFKKEDIISYNSHAYGNVALDVVAESSKLTPEKDYEEIYKKFRKSNNYSVKGSLNRSLSQTSSDVSTSNNTARSGYTFSLEYNYRFMPELEMSFGGRLDNEVYRDNSASLDIPTNRVLALIVATYHLTNFSKNENNFYLSLAAGLGRSSTVVENVTGTGVTTILPEVRLGYIMPFSKSMAMIFESSVESINSKENFNGSTDQVTNITNLKFTLGLRF